MTFTSGIPSKLMNAPLLTREREAECALAWQQRKDAKAINELIRAHLRLAVKHVARFARFGNKGEDLVQEAVLGMMRAADKFDPGKGFRFSTYATFWIKAAIQLHLWEHGTVVPLPMSTDKRALARRLSAMRDDVMSGSIAAAIADEYGASISDVQAMHVRVRGGLSISLSAPVGDDGKRAAGDTLVCEEPDPEALAINVIDGDAIKARIAEALKALKPRESEIVRLRWLGDEKMTFDELSGRFGVTRERVRQIEVMALAKLKRALAAPVQRNA